VDLKKKKTNKTTQPPKSVLAKWSLILFLNI